MLNLVFLLLSLLADPARKRWKNLRDQYMKTRKGIKDKKSGSSAGNQKTWKYYNIMIFLEPYVQERATSGNMPTEEEGEQFITLNLEAVIEEVLEELSSQSYQDEEPQPPLMPHHSPQTHSAEQTPLPSSHPTPLPPLSTQPPLKSHSSSHSAKRIRSNESSAEEHLLEMIRDLQSKLASQDEDELFLVSTRGRRPGQDWRYYKFSPT